MRFLLPSHSGLLFSEEQLWSAGLSGLNGTGGAAAIICCTGGGLRKRQGRRKGKGGEKGWRER